MGASVITPKPLITPSGLGPEVGVITEFYCTANGQVDLESGVLFRLALEKLTVQMLATYKALTVVMNFECCLCQ